MLFTVREIIVWKLLLGGLYNLDSGLSKTFFIMNTKKITCIVKTCDILWNYGFMVQQADTISKI
ncbi:hypothetical protein ACJX0J_023281, partial [Zea mays]